MTLTNMNGVYLIMKANSFEEYLDKIVSALVKRSISELQKCNDDADYSYVDDNITFDQLVTIHGLIGYGIQYCKEILKK